MKFLCTKMFAQVLEEAAQEGSSGRERKERETDQSVRVPSSFACFRETSDRRVLGFSPQKGSRKGERKCIKRLEQSVQEQEQDRTAFESAPIRVPIIPS